MDCKNFDALDDGCKGCLSGGTSVNPKEQECHEVKMKMVAIGCGQPSTVRQLVTLTGLVNDLGVYDNEK